MAAGVSAIDRNAWQYLVDVTAPSYDPAYDPTIVRDERVAMVRIALYPSEPPWITASVHEEFERITDPEVRRRNERMRDVFFHEVQPRDRDRVHARTLELRAHHSGEADCRAVAEAEAAGAVWFLSFDRELLARLTPHTPLALMTPSEYWTALGIPRGAEPARQPAASNPLASQSWWRW